MKRKILMIILCGFMILGLATGCGNKTKSESSSDKPNKTDKVEGKYAIGDKVYFNPETSKKCNMSDVEYNLDDLDKEREEVNVKSGCMRWYVINNEDNKLDLILDHRTTFETNYSNLSSGIKNDTSSWNSKLNPRAITAEQITKVIGKELDSNYIQMGNDYKWLWTGDYIQNGSTTFGYWTSTSADSGAYVVRKNGTLEVSHDTDGEYGIRPVITVEISSLK